MPRTHERAELEGRYVDDHGCVISAVPGEQLPPCSRGETMWWHESLPVAGQMLWDAERRPGFVNRWKDKRAK